MATRVEVDIKYDGYLERQRVQAENLKEIDRVVLPPDLDYEGLPGLRVEVSEKLKAMRPTTLGQASRIPGITPAAIEILRICIRRHGSALDSDTEKES